MSSKENQSMKGFNIEISKDNEASFGTKSNNKFQFKRDKLMALNQGKIISEWS